MGHRKLIKFKENEGFTCLLQPEASTILCKDTQNKGLHLNSHSIKGNWNKTMFYSPNPIIVELGCGRGEYTIDLAQRNKDCNYIGVDIKGARLWQGAKFATQNAMPNVAFLRTRIEFIEAFFAEGEVDEIWLTFSDPQLKSPNKRLTSPLFLNRYRKFLKKGGIVHLKTDSQLLHNYSKQVALQNSLQILASTTNLYGKGKEEIANSKFASICGKSAVDSLFNVQTYYERMFLDMGLDITYLSFIIDHDGDFIAPDFDEDYWKQIEGSRRSFNHSPR